MNARLRLTLALALLAAAALLGSPTPSVELRATLEGERAQPLASPYATLLSRLAPGPRSVLGLAMWLNTRVQDDARLPPYHAEDLALAMLAHAPDLERVRLDVVDRLVNRRAPAERDELRHRVLVARGLNLLDEGLSRAPTPRLYAALGRLLAEPAHGLSRDPRRTRVAEQLYGERSTEVAISALRHASELPRESVLLADLLFDRGKQSWERYRDAPAALQDFEEAEALYRAAGDARDLEVAEWLRELNALNERLDTAELQRS
ncbi:MAG: hypothetical protein DHS20C15_11190 [Planctomycetota bacterium]|nr:MAG: hypothetical protein DHS20C15_11190 [Planctomycetota bacterium]